MVVLVAGTRIEDKREHVRWLSVTVLKVLTFSLFLCSLFFMVFHGYTHVIARPSGRLMEV